MRTIEFLVLDHRTEEWHTLKLVDGQIFSISRHNDGMFEKDEYTFEVDQVSLTRSDWGFDQQGYSESECKMVCSIKDLAAIPFSWNGKQLHRPNWKTLTVSI